MTDRSITPLAFTRAPVLALSAATLLGWAFMAAMVLARPEGEGFEAFLSLCVTMQPTVGLPSLAEFASVLLMWTAMSAAMMAPTAIPAALAASAVSGERKALWFTFGYAAIYLAFACAATALQFGYGALVTVNPQLTGAGLALSGMVLLVAGLFQFTPAKMACLSRCRMPGERFRKLFAMEPRIAGFSMGVYEGVFCIGSCWLLMAVMAVLGMSNLVWTAVLGLVILAEKLTTGRLVPWFIGALLLLWGGLLVLFSPAGAPLRAQIGL